MVQKVDCGMHRAKPARPGHRLTTGMLLAALVLNPVAVVPAHGQDQTSKSESWLTRQLQQFRKYPHVDRANKLIAQNDFAAAAAELQRALEIDPGDSYVRRQLIQVLLNLNDSAGVEQQSTLLIDREPESAFGYYARALGRLRLGNAQLALTDFTRALSLKGLSPAEARVARDALADVAISLGDHETVITALAGHPTGNAYRDSMRLAQAYQAQKKTAQATDALRHAAAAASTPADRARALEELAQVQLNAKLFGSAREPLLEALSTGTGTKDTLRKLSVISESEGKAREAAEWLERLAREGPNAADMLRLARLRLEAGDHLGAMQAATQGLTLAGSGSEKNDLVLVKARSLLAAGKPLDAVKAFELMDPIAADDLEIRLEHARILEKANQPELALQVLGDTNRADFLETRAVILERLGRFDDAAEALRPLADSGEPGNRAIVAMRRAELFRKADRPQEELDSLRMALALEPDNAAYRTALADRLSTLNFDQEAAQVLEPLTSQGDESDRAKLATRLAELNRRSGDIDKELAALSRAAILAPDDPGPLDALAKRQIALGQYKAASATLRRLVTVQPNITNRLRLTDALVAAGDRAAAQQQLQRLLGDLPSGSRDRPKVLSRLGAISAVNRKWAAASSAYVNAFEISNHTDADLLMQALTAMQMQNDSLGELNLLGKYYPFAKIPAPGRNKLMSRYASALLSAGDFDRASLVLRQQVNAGTRDSAVYAQLASMLRTRNGCADAVSVLRKGLTVAKPAAPMNLELGLCYQALKRNGLAMLHLLQALQARPALDQGAQILALNTLGYLYADTEQHVRAVDVWLQSLAVRSDPVIRVKTARSLFALKQDRAASDLLQRVNAADLPNDVLGQYFDGLALAQERAGSLDAAIQYLLKGLKAEETAERHFQLSELLHRQQNSDAALTHMERAVELQPDNPRFRSTLAYRYVDAHRDADAAANFETAVKLEPDALALYEDLGYTHKRLFNNHEAVEWFEHVVDHRPDYPADAHLQVALDKKDYRIRREIEQLENRLILNAAASFRTGSVANVAPSPLRDSTLAGQGSVELAYQPDMIGYRDGRILQLFGRLFWGFEEESVVPRDESLQAGLGIRYKPLKDWNFYVSGERLIAIGDDSRDDWLLRASVSFDHGLDWIPHDRYWPYGSIYLDAAHAVEDDVNFLTFDLREGMAFKIADKFALIPAALASAGYNDDADDEISKIEIGLGVSIKSWFNETIYEAPRSEAELGLEYRIPVAGNSDDDAGVLLRAQLRL